MKSPVGLAFFAAALLVPLSVHAGVTINEIFYQPAGIPENSAREFIELYNSDPVPATVSAWKLKGVDFTFPAGTTIPANGYLVIAANTSTFQTTYPGVTNVVGNWTGSLSNSSERIRLENDSGGVEDEVTYADSGDWAVRTRESTYGGWEWRSAANGEGRSLELRNPALDHQCGQNWGDSAVTGGTPGGPNSIPAANIAPLIKDVSHWPALPTPSEQITISCKLADESPAANLSASVHWRNASSTVPGAFQSVAMSGDGSGYFSVALPAQPAMRIIEFFVEASDGTNTRTWPAPTSEGQNANCQFQVINETLSSSSTYYFLILTAAENAAFNSVASNSDRQFNQTLVAVRGGDTTIRYRGSMRIRGNSSRSYQFKPLRISLPKDTPWDGATLFNLNPRSSYLQHLGMRMFQAAGLRASDTIPVELRRNGIESTTSTGTTPDFGMWVRVEDEGDELIDRHWPEANGGSVYKKRRPDRYWRNTGWSIPPNANGEIDGWSKQNNSAANNWSDLTSFFARIQSVAAPHFPGAPPNDSAASTGVPLTTNGNWNGTAFTAAEVTSLEAVADLDQWARWFAVMTILQDIETNISNGEDDDYGMYFVPSAGGQRRAQLLPHDLDTIFGFGDTPVAFNGRGLYDMTTTGSIFRPLLPLFGNSANTGNAAFKTKYFNAIRELYGSIFNASTTSTPYPAFYAFVDQHLKGWIPDSRIATIRTFATSRQTFLLTQIGASAIPPVAPTSSATGTSPHGNLMISEVIANTTGTASFDAIELYNAGSESFDLSGYSLSDDPSLPFKRVLSPGTTIAAGGYLILQADPASGVNQLPFVFRDGGGGVYLYGPATSGGALIDSVAFGSQPSGYSIGRTGPSMDTWTLCTPTLGSANAAVPSLAQPGSVRINEWLGNVGYQFDSDFIELYNPALQPVAIGGMSITDDSINYPQRYVLPPLSYLGPRSFLRMDARGSDAAPGVADELPFKIDGAFGSVALIGQNGAIADRVDVMAQSADVSTGRSPDGDSNTTRFGLPGSLATPGMANVLPPENILALMDNLRVTEILYRPDNIEYIELQNIGIAALDLSGVRFSKGITYEFAPGTTLAPGALIVVCKDRAAFQTQFGPAVPLASGQFTGSLSNSGETIALQLPEPWNAYILNFKYDASWYAAANSGYALTLNNQIATHPSEWSERRAWSPSLALGGTPGTDTAPTIVSALTVGSVVGDPFQYQIVATKRPTSYAATGVPPGLTFDTASGVISGTFSSPGTYNLDISAINSGGTDTKTLVINVLSSGPLSAFEWDTVSSPQEAGKPIAVRIQARDLQGRTVTSFNGSVSLGIAADVAIGDGTSSWNFPLGTFYHDARTQSIYLASEIGGAARITGLALDVVSVPPQTLTNWTIRMKHTSLASYSAFVWESRQSGWVTVYQANETIASPGLATFIFSTPFEYDGTSNLMIDFSFNNNSYTTDGYCRYTPTSSTRSFHYQTDSDYGDPLNWPEGSSPVPNAKNQIPNIKLIRENNTSVSPETTSPFANGAWAGAIVVSGPGRNVIVRAKDGVGHSGSSNPFDAVVLDLPIITSPGEALAVVGQPFSYQILATAFPNSFNATGLPGNLGVNTSTGLISGIPAAAGNASINLTASNTVGNGNGAFLLTVQDDTDGDGMGDAWEITHGLNPADSADAALDRDGDGQSNFEEWISGTLPDDPNSCFLITEQERVASGIRITWKSTIGKRYRVLSRTSLVAGTWTDLTPVPVVATGSTSAWTHAGGDTGLSRFYRVEIVR